MPTKTDYALKVRYDDSLVPVAVCGIEIPTCQNCGEKVITLDVDEQVNAALRRQLLLLSPTQIHEGVARAGISTKETAARLGVSEDQLWRWINGYEIQSRAMDNYLRVFFQFPQVREMLIAPSAVANETLVAIPATT